MIVVDATPLQTEHRYRGPGVYTAGLLDAMARLAFPEPISLLQQARRPDDVPLPEGLAARTDVSLLRVHRPHWPRYHAQWLLSLLALRPALRRSGARLYHATEPNSLVLVPGITTVATLYDLIPLHDPSAHFPLRRCEQRYGYARYLRLLQRADRLIAISEASKRDAVARLRIPPERIVVTPLAVDERRFYPRSPAEIDASAMRYGLRRPYFLHVGASAPQKNTGNLLRAFARFHRESGGNHALYVAGKWTARALAAVQSAYPDLVARGTLRVLGFVPDDDLPALYGGATALVYPSLVEGFGLPVLEAMRCATPVLTSRTSSLPEVAGEAALYVDPASVDEMAAALQRLAAQNDLRTEMIERGQSRASLFSWESTARETLKVYEELL